MTSDFDRETVCAIDECVRPHYGQGMCRQHWGMVRRHPLVVRKAMRDVALDKFMVQVLVGADAECWEWSGSRNAAGYGTFYVGPASVAAHRFSALRLAGLDIKGKVVRHKCDNPPCVNPGHLEVGTIADNNRDTALRGRRAKTTHCPKGHEMTESNTKSWVTRDGYTARACRECSIRRVRAWRARKKEVVK